MKALDLQGERFGRWIVLERAPSNGRNARWFCRCDCGTTGVVTSCNLSRGHSRSCGCLVIDALVGGSFRHGGAGRRRHTPEYRAWWQAKERCFNPKCQRYPAYGGRGITMHDGWVHDFSAFLAHIGPRPSAAHSLDRIDVDGNYAPGNVRWATKREQDENRRATRRYDFHGDRVTIRELSERSGVPYSLLRSRLDRGWPIDRALMQPTRRRVA